MGDSRSDLARETREVYLKQHKRYHRDEVFFERFLRMASDPTYYHLSKQDFAGKKILDAGCGNSAYFEVAMWQLGVGHITCLDLGDSWKDPLQEALRCFEIPDSALNLVSGSIDRLPFEDNAFDMVFSNGVLMHLYDMNQIQAAFRELGRVTRPGGYLYVLLGAPGGLFEAEVLPAIRRFYRSNDEFHELIDALEPKHFAELFNIIQLGMLKHTKEPFPISSQNIATLFSNEFCTFIQNIIQVPRRIVLEMDEKFVVDSFTANGFEKPLQCKRYVKRKDFRKFLAPLHYESENPYSRILYGPGNLEYIARKLDNGDIHISDELQP
jgi:SAM-dependent methyltransferase